jgi:hypothetical protein
LQRVERYVAALRDKLLPGAVVLNTTIMVTRISAIDRVPPITPE